MEPSFRNVKNATLYVPATSIEAYRTAWGSVFTDIIPSYRLETDN